MTVKIETLLELPYNLIEINTDSEHFAFRFKEFDADQTDYSIKSGGVTGEFGVVYKCRGIDACFGCDITVGNVYDFYVALDNAYDILFGKETVTVMQNYGSEIRTKLTVKSDSRGHCFITGSFKNKDALYKSGISFEIEADQTYIPEMLGSMEAFFNEMRRIQGHGIFY